MTYFDEYGSRRITGKQLSDNFNEREFLCTCNGQHCSGLHEDGVNPLLVILLQRIREYYDKPVVLNSGYRCPQRNEDVGGVPKTGRSIGSRHMYGTAADIRIQSVPARKVGRVAEDLLRELRLKDERFKGVYGGIGIYPRRFTHIDVRKSKARWTG